MVVLSSHSSVIVGMLLFFGYTSVPGLAGSKTLSTMNSQLSVGPVSHSCGFPTPAAHPGSMGAAGRDHAGVAAGGRTAAAAAADPLPSKDRCL